MTSRSADTRALVFAGWLSVAALALATYGLRHYQAVHALDAGATGASPSPCPAPVAVPTATVAAILLFRGRARMLGLSMLLAAVLLGVGRFGAAAVGFASPPPLGFSSYAFPGLGAVAVFGRVADVAAVAVAFVGSATSLGATRLTRRSRLAWRIAACGVGLVAIGVATTPTSIIASFSSAVDSPLALPNFEAAATTLRLVGLLVCTAAAGIAGLGAFERLRRVSGDARRQLVLLGSCAGLTVTAVVVGIVLDASPLRTVSVALVAVVLPVVMGGVGDRFDGIGDAPIDDVPSSRPVESSFETVAVRVLAVARLAAALWAFALFTAFRESFEGPVPALLLSAAILTSILAAVNVVRSTVHWRVLSAFEVTIASALVYADGAASGNGHLFSGASGLGGPWPTVVVAAAGAAGGPLVGFGAGFVVGTARVAGVLASGVHVFAAQGQGLAGGVVGLIAVGLASGALLAALREAERRIASARAREAVARRLHDGVLQALAVVRRRSKDADLVALVADADRDLRAFLDRGDAEGEIDLEGGLRRAADESERRFGLSVVVVVDELPRRVAPNTVQAVVGAVSEALANVAKHSGVKQATVFAGIDDEHGHYVSVTDRGKGFDVGAIAPGRGLSGSVTGRMDEVGGSATVRSLKGGGTQVMLCLP